MTKIKIVFFAGVLLFSSPLFSQNQQSYNAIKKKIEQAQKYIVQSNVKNTEQNTLLAIDELNAAMSMAVYFPVTHYLLGQCYWTISQKTKKYSNQKVGLYDNTLLVKSYFHFSLYKHLVLDENEKNEALKMIKLIESAYSQEFFADNKFIDDFFIKNIIYNSETMGELCYSLALEAEKNKDSYKAVAYYSFVDFFKSPSKYVSYAQNRHKTLTNQLDEQNRKDEATLKRIAKNKKITWNNTFLDNTYYSYLFQTPLIANSSYMHGIQVTKLRNKGVAYYFSVTTNNPAFIFQQSFNKYTKNEYVTTIKDTYKNSSSYLSAGITQKIYRPFFLTAGVGGGLTTHSSKYTTFSQTQELWLIDKYSWSISPEIGLVIADPFPLYFTANVKYVFPLNKSEGLSYNNFVYSFGIGLTLPRPARRFNLLYNMEFPVLKKVTFSGNENMMGIIFGANNGIYFSLRINRLLFNKKENYYTFSGKGNMFFTAGYEQRIFYPLYIYAGAGIAYQQWLKNNYDSELEKQVNLNTDFGISLQISYLKLRAGMTIPINFKKFNFSDSYLAVGIGANF